MNFSIDEFKNDDFGSASLKFLQEIHLNSKMNLKSNGLMGALIALKLVGEWHNKFEFYLTEIKKNFIKRIKESKFNKSKDIERVGSFGEGEHGVFNDEFYAIVGVTVFILYVI